MGRKLSSPIIIGLKTVIKNFEDELLETKQAHSTFKAELLELQAKHANELNDQQLVEAGLRAKLQKLERTPAEANRQVLRDFL